MIWTPAKSPDAQDKSLSVLVVLTRLESPVDSDKLFIPARHRAAPEAVTDVNCQRRTQQEEQTSLRVLVSVVASQNGSP